MLAYDDEATAVMPDATSGMRITEIVLRPRITVRGGVETEVVALVEKAHDQCFIANSLNTPVRVEPRIEIAA